MAHSTVTDKPSPKRPALAERQPRVSPMPPPSMPADATVQSQKPIKHDSQKHARELSLEAKPGIKLPAIDNKRVSLVTEEDSASAKRDSQVSTTSTISVTGKSKRKTHVGPWQLGKTLGKGATGRVRLAKHAMTGQSAAIKIVSKKSAALAQSASMKQISSQDTVPINAAGMRTIPFGIEREVVIMKLIEHPNIISLYDIWENRGELYLVLEYVQGGELFDYISTYGALPEEEAVRLFRQMIAALSYCHRFNICHRDLKPENVLLDANRNIKLADFGMAALQPADELLTTSCGSPHYAAPEIIQGRKYHGNMADIWSVGIILFAMLNGFLPFDGGSLPNTLRLVKKGEYFLSPTLSREAVDLIQRILQKTPEDRISMKDIWSHPLVLKWERFHESLVPPGTLVGPPPALDPEDCEKPISKRSEIDLEVLRNLQTLWHGQKQEDLIKQLMTDEPNHEKLFYRALLKFREDQLENYPGDALHYSASDYHHVTKSKPKKPTPRHGNGLRNHQPRNSQFSIASEDGHHGDGYYKNSATAGSVTTKGSYDPYRSSKTPLIGQNADSTMVVIRHGSNASRTRNANHPGSLRRPAVSKIQSGISALPPMSNDGLEQRAHPKRHSHSAANSRSSLASSRRGGSMRNSASYKRQVSFQHRRRASSGISPGSSRQCKHRRLASQDTESVVSGMKRDQRLSLTESQSDPTLLSPVRANRPRKPASGLEMRNARTSSHHWRDEARKVSNELGKICEEAFNRSSLSSSEVSQRRPSESPATSVSIQSDAVLGSLNSKSRNRPLPETPPESMGMFTMQELVETRRILLERQGDRDPVQIKEFVAKLDRVLEIERRKQANPDQRSTSDPTHTFHKSHKSSHAPISTESGMPSNSNTLDDLKNRGGPDSNLRTASDPIQLSKKSKLEDATIRLVSPDPMSPISSIEPLQIRKNKFLTPINTSRASSIQSSNTNLERHGIDFRSYGKSGLDTIEEDPKSPKRRGITSPTSGRKWSWLGKRSSSSQDDAPPTPPMKNSPENSESNGQLGAEKSLPQNSSRSFKPPKSQGTDTDEVAAIVQQKRRWFKKMFGRGGQAKVHVHASPADHEIAIEMDETDSATTSTDDYLDHNSYPPHPTRKIGTSKNYTPVTSVEAAAAAAAASKRPIQISQNWFAKVFHIKPASRAITMQVGKACARKEIVKILKDWRRFGLRDVVVRKVGEMAGMQGDLVRGRVDEVNYLHLKPVFFHAYLYEVLERGRKANLSVIKFTQEKGAASSFYKVVDTLSEVLRKRDMLVVEEVRRKAIEKMLKDMGL